MLNIEGSLTMGTAGEITNSGSDYSITENGMTMEATIQSGKTPADQIPEPNALNWTRSTLEAGAIAAYFPDSTIDITEARLGLSAGEGQGRIELEANIIDVGDLPTSDPGIPGALWRSGGDVQVST